MYNVIKCFLLLTLFFPFDHSQSQTQFSDIFFLDDHNGWVLSTDNYLWKTTNAGNNWLAIYDTSIDNSGKIFFIDEQHGWMLLNTTLLFSEDGGNTWMYKYEFPQFSGIFDLSFVNQNVGFVINDFNLYKTTNAGNEWTQLIDTLGSISSISTYDQNLIFISASKSSDYLLKSTDLGVTWNISNEFGSLDFSYFGEVQMLNENYGISLFNFYEFISVSRLLKTSDSGNSWDAYGSGFEFLFGINDFDFASENVGYVTTKNRYVYKTINSGLSWDSLQSPYTLSESIENIEFFNQNISFGINRNHIYKTTDEWVTYSIVDSIVTGINEQQITATEFILEQNFPNPFNPSTKIKYSIPQTGFVNIAVYDLLGHEISTLVNDYRPSGIYEIDFVGKGLASGIYFCKLVSKNFNKTIKMILLK